MYKTITTLFLLFVAAFPVLAQDGIWFDGSYEDALEKAKKENKLVLVNFSGDG